MDIKIYRTGIFSDVKQELIATAANLQYADIICTALVQQGISCMAEDQNGEKVLDDVS